MISNVLFLVCPCVYLSVCVCVCVCGPKVSLQHPPAWLHCSGSVFDDGEVRRYRYIDQMINRYMHHADVCS